jgi:hypothetical protein
VRQHVKQHLINGGKIMQFKQLKLITNHKTNKQSIEYRVYSEEDIFKTIAPRKWIHLDLEDRTPELERCECNDFLVRNAIKDNIGLGIELNQLIHAYKVICMSRHDAIADFAKKYNIAQI